jgi:hypothetical protein
MPFQQSERIRYFEFDSLRDEPVVQAVFTRQGGVSPAPWHSLNLGSTVGDEVRHVASNRQRALSAVGRSEDSIYDVWQVHSAVVSRGDAPRPSHIEHQLADAIITNRPAVTLLMRFADCTPILLFDPLQKAVGLVHAGWQGTVKNVVGRAVEAMHATYGTHPANILAAIGPSIGPDHYEIGPDVISQVQRAFGSDSSGLLPKHHERFHFDLWAANRLLLEQAGVRMIETAGLCTACHLHDWFSHRAEKGQTGRFGAVIGLAY